MVPAGWTGFSSSNYSRQLISHQRTALTELRSRPLDSEAIVAVKLDGTWIGHRNKKETVLVVVGITADGRKLVLDAAIVPKGEPGDAIRPVLERIVKRGVDPGVLWIADGGKGIRAAIEAVTGPMPAVFQTCTTHVRGNVLDTLPKTKEMKALFVDRLYGAWAQDDAEVALSQLKAFADELDQLGATAKKRKAKKGFHAAATSLRNSMNDTVTVQRLGLVGEIRHQMRSTNDQEARNSQLKRRGSLANVTRWRNPEMLLRQVAWHLLYFERNSWNRLADPGQLVGLLKRLLPGRRDHEAILAKLPPSMSLHSLPVTFGDDARMREIATEWCAEHPNATPIGSPGALDALGLPGKEMTPDALVEAMRCLDPKTGKRLRTTQKISVESVDAAGRSVKVKADGILNLKWSLAASPSVMREWLEGGTARERVEADFMNAAAAAVQRATRTGEPAHGFAAIAALHRPSAEDPEQPLRIDGITFAVQRGEGARLGSPVTKEGLKSGTARAAEDTAKAVLAGESPEVATAESDPASSGPAADGAEAGPLSPELVAAVKAMALELAPGMVVERPEELLARAERLEDAAKALGTVDEEVRNWREKNWNAAARQIAAVKLGRRPRDGPQPSVWWPLGRGLRAVLGEMHSQWLLGDAAQLVGLSDDRTEEAPKLREADGDPLAELQQGPVARVKAAAEALAATRELARRHQFEVARADAGREALPPPALRDSRGELSASPVVRYRDALGSDRAAALARYAEAVAPEVRELDDATLRHLAAKSAGAWEELDRDSTSGVRLDGLERRRDEDLGKWLETMGGVGRETAAGKHAEARHDSAALIAAADRAKVAKKEARDGWGRLRKLERQTEECRQDDGSPMALIEDHPEAAIYHAAHAELVRLERAREAAVQATEPPPPARDPAGSSADQLRSRREPTSELDRGKEVAPINRSGMASFEAERIVVTDEEARSSPVNRSVSAGEWQWIGHQWTLSELGVEDRGRVEEDSYRRLAGGRNADTGEAVREAKTVRRESERVQGLVHVSGRLRVPEALAAWRNAGPEERNAISAKLVDEARGGITRIAGTDRIAGAATVAEVGEGAEAAVQVELIAFAADRDNGLDSPLGGQRAIEAAQSFGEEAGERLRGWLAARPAEVAAEVPAPRAEATPQRPPTLSSRPSLPDQPLRDSLTANLTALGIDDARRLKREAEQLEAHVLTDEELRKQLSQDELRRGKLGVGDPFAALPANPSRAELDHWWNKHGLEAARVVAAEGQLIENRRRGYAALAEKRNEPLANPMEAVEKNRGKEFAAKVERRATVFASHLGKMPEEERQKRTAVVNEYLNRVDIKEAKFGAIVERVAFQHYRNVDREQEAARQAETPASGVERAPAAGLTPADAGNGIG